MHSRPSLQWRHNERDSVSNHQPHDCLLNCLFKAQIKENIKALRHWPLCREFTGDRWIPCTNGQVTRKMFPFDDAIMGTTYLKLTRYRSTTKLTHWSRELWLLTWIINFQTYIMYRYYQSDKDRYLEYIVRNCPQVMINQFWFNYRQATSRYLNQWWPNYMVPYGVTHGQWGDKSAWWRHQMESFSALLAICAGNSPVSG